MKERKDVRPNNLNRIAGKEGGTYHGLRILRGKPWSTYYCQKDFLENGGKNNGEGLGVRVGVRGVSQNRGA